MDGVNWSMAIELGGVASFLSTESQSISFQIFIHGARRLLFSLPAVARFIVCVQEANTQSTPCNRL